MSKTILLVDDEVEILRAIQRVLLRAGYKVLLAESAEAGLQLLAKQQVALVLSDFRMPAMRGAEFLHQVKILYPNTIGMILSGYADREALIECLNSGAAWKFLEKPWVDAELLDAIAEALQERDRRFAELQRTNLLMSSEEALLELTANGQVRRFNTAAAHVMELQPSELRDRALSELFIDINPIELAIFFHKKDHEIILMTPQQRKISLSHRISDIHHYLLKILPIEALRSQVFSESASLLNQTELRSQVEDLLSSAQQQFAVVVLSIADYHQIDASLSANQLDQLLVQIGKLLLQQLPEKALLGYVSTDRFMAVLPGLSRESLLHQSIDKLLQPFKNQLVIDSDKVQLSFSIGYALSPVDGESARQLLHHADVACRQNEVNPRAFYLRFDRDMIELKRQQFEISNSLYAALEEGQFQLYFQPKIRLTDGICEQAEALIRWQHPTMGWISPALFIPIAEHDGQINAIGSWVLEQCFKQLELWQQTNMPITRLAINLSGRQLQDEQLSGLIEQQLKRYGIAAAQVEFEVTETFLMQDIEASALMLLDLKQQGCHVAMDDFGTGYSSLAYLAKLPVDVLKLDRSLLLELEDSPQSVSMVRHMVRMAHDLNMQVVAEGIESAGQVRLLSDMQCDLVQGYVFSTPLTLTEFEQFLRVQPAKQTLELMRYE